MRLRRAGFLVAVAGLLTAASAASAAAQPWPAESALPSFPPPLTITIVDGPVELVRDGRVESAHAPDVFDEGERLVTNGGRAELAVPDGGLAHVDRDTDLRVDPGVVLRLVAGRVIVRTSAEGQGLDLATPAGALFLEPGGEYDLAAADLAGDTEVHVHVGRAVMRGGDRDVVVAPGIALLMHPRDRVPRWARPPAPDAFAAWAEDLADEAEHARTAALPVQLQPWAGDLDAHGSWTALAPYGQVWFPAAGRDWRPFVSGTWRYTRHGWTWIDADRWAWPLHHYGRWGHHDVRGWYWIPHRQWGPGWVGWAVGADHVAWAPLGWNARPLVDFSVGARIGPTGLWASSWSIVPRRVFGRRDSIRGHLENPQHLPGPVLGGFVSQMIGPRGPASHGDRYAVRPRRPAGRGWGGPPRPDARAARPRTEEPPAPELDAPPAARESAPVRRPTDAPPRWRDDAGAAEIARPDDRAWSTARGRSAADGRRVPTGPPVRPQGARGEPSRGDRPGAAPPATVPSGDRGRGRAWEGARGARQTPGSSGTTADPPAANPPTTGPPPGSSASGGQRRGNGRDSGAAPRAGGSRRRPG